jgi:phospholipid/cholesterol/gamma-HCH transport system ATP-binding protein
MAIDKLVSVGLSADILDSYPAQLSGGMQKRVSLARAICTNPKILFLDEPTTGLDPIMTNVINELIMKIRDQLGSTTITITHDIDSARKISTDIAMMHQGKILWHGSQKQIEESNNPYVHQFINGLTIGPFVI